MPILMPMSHWYCSQNFMICEHVEEIGYFGYLSSLTLYLPKRVAKYIEVAITKTEIDNVIKLTH